jgi:hypothetical protein
MLLPGHQSCSQDSDVPHPCRYFANPLYNPPALCEAATYVEKAFDIGLRAADAGRMHGYIHEFDPLSAISQYQQPLPG